MVLVESVTPPIEYFVRGVPIAVAAGPGTFTYMFDAREFKPNLIILLEDCAARWLNALLPRPGNAPRLSPWGEVRYVRQDMPLPARLDWRFSPDGILIDVPKGCVSDKNARLMSQESTKAMCYYDPPPLWNLWGPLLVPPTPRYPFT